MENEKRLIDLDLAIERAKESDKIVRSSIWETEEVVEFLEDCPIEDAAEVVRCKDCKRYRTDSCAMSYTDRNENMPHCWSRTNDFCSYGERKDDG